MSTKYRGKYHVSTMLKWCAQSVGLKMNSGKKNIVTLLREQYGYPGGMDRVLEQHTDHLRSTGLPIPLWSELPSYNRLKRPHRPSRSVSYVTERTDFSTDWITDIDPEGPPWSETTRSSSVGTPT